MGYIKQILGIKNSTFAMLIMSTWHFDCFAFLQFSFRKEKNDKKYKQYRSGLGGLNEGNESNDSDHTSKVETMSVADVDRYLEQMLVSVKL